MLHDRKPRFQDASELMSAAEESEGVLGAARVGAELRAARLRLGWRLPDVAQALRIRLPYLEAIEDGRLGELPGNAYAMGFLRAYAGMLGLDAAEMARRFKVEAQEVTRKTELAFPAPVPERGVPAGAIVLLGVVIAAGAYGAWYTYSGDRQPPPATIPAVPERLAPLADRAAVPAAPPPSPQVASVLPPPGTPLAPAPTAVPGAVVAPAPTPVAPPAPPAPAVVLPPVDASRVSLRAKADAWVQVREKNGPMLLNRVLRAGEAWVVPKGQALVMTTGNAGGVEVLLDGAPTVPLGPTGQVKKDVSLEPEALKVAGSTARPSPQ